MSKVPTADANIFGPLLGEVLKLKDEPVVTEAQLDDIQRRIKGKQAEMIAHYNQEKREGLGTIVSSLTLLCDVLTRAVDQLNPIGETPRV